MKNKTSKVIRMWHKKDNDWCYAWDVDPAAFNLWKAGKGPLSAKSVWLPKGKGNPPIGTQVRCGSCGSVDVVPKLMREELVSLDGS